MDHSSESRDETLRALYSVYWGNMARSMEGIWQILGPITVAGTVIGAVHGNYLPAPLGISLAMLIVLWGVNVTIDLNQWHRRNLFFVSKAEQKLLEASDYGTLLPRAYRIPKTEWIAFYKINVLVFLTFGVLLSFYAMTKLSNADLLAPGIVTGVGAVATGMNWRAQEVSTLKHFGELFPTE